MIYCIYSENEDMKGARAMTVKCKKCSNRNFNMFAKATDHMTIEVTENFYDKPCFSHWEYEIEKLKCKKCGEVLWFHDLSKEEKDEVELKFENCYTTYR